MNIFFSCDTLLTIKVGSLVGSDLGFWPAVSGIESKLRGFFFASSYHPYEPGRNLVGPPNVLGKRTAAPIVSHSKATLPQRLTYRRRSSQ